MRGRGRGRGMEGRRGERKSGQGGRSDIWEEEGMSGEKREKRQVILVDFSLYE